MAQARWSTSWREGMVGPSTCGSGSSEATEISTHASPPHAPSLLMGRCLETPKLRTSVCTCAEGGTKQSVNHATPATESRCVRGGGDTVGGTVEEAEQR